MPPGGLPPSGIAAIASLPMSIPEEVTDMKLDERTSAKDVGDEGALAKLLGVSEPAIAKEPDIHSVAPMAIPSPREELDKGKPDADGKAPPGMLAAGAADKEKPPAMTKTVAFKPTPDDEDDETDDKVAATPDVPVLKRSNALTGEALERPTLRHSNDLSAQSFNSIASFEKGQEVLCRSPRDEEWKPGIVTSVSPLKVKGEKDWWGKTGYEVKVAEDAGLTPTASTNPSTSEAPPPPPNVEKLPKDENP